MKVASMNLEYYMASPSMWGHSNGAKDEAAFQRQRKKVLAAMKEIDADVYAICEIEEGDYSVNELVQALNEEYGVTGKYKGIERMLLFMIQKEFLLIWILKLMKAHIWFFVMWHNALS